MRQNTTKARLDHGEAVFGVYLRYADPGLAEALGYMGWDYLLFDGEHCPLSGRETEHLARVCEITGATPIARVAANQPYLIGQFLDAGIQAVQIPMVAGRNKRLRPCKPPSTGLSALAEWLRRDPRITDNCNRSSWPTTSSPPMSKPC